MSYTKPFFAVEVTGSGGTIHASDAGYRTRDSDPSGVVPYPAILADAFQVTRAIALAPGQSAAGAAWGTLSLRNVNGALDTAGSSWNNSGRAVRVLLGAKTLDATRGLWTDPAYASLTPAFVGVSAPWVLTDTTLDVPLRDASFWLDQPLQTAAYGGTGGYDGDTGLRGVLKPKLRGHAVHITPVLIDSANLIYQYNDSTGSINTLYEGRKATYAFDSDTANLYSGSTPSGKYRTDNSRGLFQLGSAPTYNITLTADGGFPSAGYKDRPGEIAHNLLLEDIGLSSTYIDSTTFTAAEALAYVSGFYFAPDSGATGISALEFVLTSIAAKLYPKRDGTLAVFLLHKLAGTETPVATFDTTNIETLVPRALPAEVSPAPWRIRCGYAHNYTVQSSGLNPTAVASDMALAPLPDQSFPYTNTTLQAAYARPGDVPVVQTGLSDWPYAQIVVNVWGHLWATTGLRRLFDITVPTALGLAVDIGDVVKITWPSGGLSGGALAQVVGDSFRSMDPTITLTVLV